MQSTSVDDQDRDTASLVPEWPTAMETRSSGFKNDHLASGRPSIVRRMFRALARFSIAVLIGIGAMLAWQSHGDEVKDMVSTWFPSLRWLTVLTTTSPTDGQGSAQDAARPQSAPALQRAAPADAATTPELAQLEPMARDLAAMRHSLEQLAVKQEQMAQNMAALQAAEQDIRQKMLSPPLSQTVSVPPRRPPKPPARSSPVQSPPVPTPPPAAQSPSQTRSGSP
jgi:hypothetical protein